MKSIGSDTCRCMVELKLNIQKMKTCPNQATASPDLKLD